MGQLLNKVKDSDMFSHLSSMGYLPRWLVLMLDVLLCFCAYILASNGYKVNVIERGKPVEERSKDVEKFWEEGVLNPNSNVQFGEGGAGCFSDGKLNTLVKDKFNRMQKVFEVFVECGAPKDILHL